MTEKLDAPIVAPTNGVPKAAPTPAEPAAPPQPAGEPAPAASQPGTPQQPSDKPPPVPPVPKKITGKKIAIAILLLVVVAGGAYFVWKMFFAAPATPASIVVLSGRIEGDDSAVAAKTTGRLLEVRVREGDLVKAGATIAVLDDQAAAPLKPGQSGRRGYPEYKAVRGLNGYSTSCCRQSRHSAAHYTCLTRHSGRDST